jgi:hypothetical protein
MGTLPDPKNRSIIRHEMQFAVACPERNSLLDRYVAAANAHARAAEELRAMLQVALKDQFEVMAKVTERAATRCWRAHTEFERHQRLHKC